MEDTVERKRIRTQSYFAQFDQEMLSLEHQLRAVYPDFFLLEEDDDNNFCDPEKFDKELERLEKLI